MPIESEKTANSIELTREQTMDKALQSVARVIKKQDERPSIVCKDGKIVSRGDESLGLAILMDELNAASFDSTWHLIDSAAAGNTFTDRDENITYAVNQLRALAPETAIEGLLISQMVAVDGSIKKCMKNITANNVSLDVQLQLTNSVTKLQRTFLQQIEALQKLRGKAQQTVKVEHVNVHAGGQAIVGNVEGGK